MSTIKNLFVKKCAIAVLLVSFLASGNALGMSYGQSLAYGLAQVGKGIGAVVVGAGCLLGDAAKILPEVGSLAQAYPRTATIVAGASLFMSYQALNSWYKSFNKESEELIKESKKLTEYLKQKNEVGADRRLMYWRYGKTPVTDQRTTQWMSPAHINQHSKDVYEELKENWKIGALEDNAFRQYILDETKIERKMIEAIKKEIVIKLKFNPSIKTLIKDTIDCLDLKTLTDKQIESISNAINNYKAWNICKHARALFLFPYEQKLLQEYWKLSILQARLNAFDMVVVKKS